MKAIKLVLPSLLLGGAGLLIVPGSDSLAFSKIGGSLGITQRDVRLFNNFTDTQANNNTNPASQYPGYLGADLAIWKGVTEWGSDPFGDGSGDVSGNILGGADANFDAFWAGNASGVGGTNDNIVSGISSCSGSTLAFTETPISNGWRIRFCEAGITWHDGPGFFSGGFDIQGVMCHEYGHALGLGHSTVGNATMFPSVSSSSTAIRSIEADDEAGLRDGIYSDEAGDKPRIEATVPSGGTLTIHGANFSGFNNRVWFTPSGSTSTGGDPRVIVGSASSSSGGTQITVAIPAGAGPGNVLVERSAATNGSDISNAFPTDLVNPFGVPPAPPIQLTSISPANIPALDVGTAESVTLTGSGMLSVTEVMFFIPGFEIQIDPSRWTVVNDTTITVDMPQAIQLGTLPISVSDGVDFATLNVDFVEVSSPQLEIGTGDPLNIVDVSDGLPVIVAGSVGEVVWMFASASQAPSSTASVMMGIGNNFTQLTFLGAVTIGGAGYTELFFSSSALPTPSVSIIRFAQGVQLTLPIPLPVSNVASVIFVP